MKNKNFSILTMCNISLPFSGQPTELVNRAKNEIARAGGQMNGDENGGNFQAKTPIGSIAGNYAISNQQINISILKKPFLLSCSRIEKELKKVMH